MQQDSFVDTIAEARARYGPSRSRSCSALRHPASERPRRLTGDEPDGQLPARLRQSMVHTAHSLGQFVQNALGLTGVCATVTTACSSSAKVFGQAERMIRCGIADAAVVGGVDTLCGSVLFGFNSLELISAEPCRPFDVDRRGISIGEAGGFALLERDGRGPWLLGYGESSDAHHMSTPHPEGLGARLAIEAFARSDWFRSTSVTSICMAPRAPERRGRSARNRRLFPETTHASSTKGWTGHALGAAGISRPPSACLRSTTVWRPAISMQQLDPACGPQIRLENAQLPRPSRCPIRLGSAAAIACWHSARSVCMNADAAAVSVEGVSLWASSLPGWDSRVPSAARPSRRRPPGAAHTGNAAAGRAPSRAGLGRAWPSRLRHAPARRRPRSLTTAERIRVHSWRSRHHRLHVRVAGPDTAAHLPDEIPQLGAQCGRGLLVYRDRLPRALHDGQCLRSFVLRRVAGDLYAGRERRTPVLCVAYDIEASGPLRLVAASRGLLGVALVLAPSGDKSHRTLTLRVEPGSASNVTSARSAAAALVADNALAPCLPFFEALADPAASEVVLALSDHCLLHAQLS